MSKIQDTHQVVDRLRKIADGLTASPSVEPETVKSVVERLDARGATTAEIREDAVGPVILPRIELARLTGAVPELGDQLARLPEKTDAHIAAALRALADNLEEASQQRGRELRQYAMRRGGPGYKDHAFCTDVLVTELPSIAESLGAALARMDFGAGHRIADRCHGLVLDVLGETAPGAFPALRMFNAGFRHTFIEGRFERGQDGTWIWNDTTHERQADAAKEEPATLQAFTAADLVMVHGALLVQIESLEAQLRGGWGDQDSARRRLASCEDLQTAVRQALADQQAVRRSLIREAIGLSPVASRVQQLSAAVVQQLWSVLGGRAPGVDSTGKMATDDTAALLGAETARLLQLVESEIEKARSLGLPEATIGWLEPRKLNTRLGLDSLSKRGDELALAILRQVGQHVAGAGRYSEVGKFLGSDGDCYTLRIDSGGAPSHFRPSESALWRTPSAKQSLLASLLGLKKPSGVTGPEAEKIPALLESERTRLFTQALAQVTGAHARQSLSDATISVSDEALNKAMGFDTLSPHGRVAGRQLLEHVGKMLAEDGFYTEMFYSYRTHRLSIDFGSPDFHPAPSIAEWTSGRRTKPHPRSRAAEALAAYEQAGRPPARAALEARLLAEVDGKLDSEIATATRKGLDKTTLGWIGARKINAELGFDALSPRGSEIATEVLKKVAERAIAQGRSAEVKYTRTDGGETYFLRVDCGASAP